MEPSGHLGPVMGLICHYIHVSWYIVQESCFSQYCSVSVTRANSIILRTILRSADVGCREEFFVDSFEDGLCGERVFVCTAV